MSSVISDPYLKAKYMVASLEAIPLIWILYVPFKPARFMHVLLMSIDSDCSSLLHSMPICPGQSVSQDWHYCPVLYPLYIICFWKQQQGAMDCTKAAMVPVLQPVTFSLQISSMSNVPKFAKGFEQWISRYNEWLQRSCRFQGKKRWPFTAQL